jgi:hypothetical protein
MAHIAIMIFIVAILILIASETMLDRENEVVNAFQNIVCVLCAFLMILALAMIDIIR